LPEQDSYWRPTLSERSTYTPQPYEQQLPAGYRQTTDLSGGGALPSDLMANLRKSGLAPAPTAPPPIDTAAKARAAEAPPQNPREALDYQFYGAQETQRRQEELFAQMMEAFARAQEQSSRDYSSMNQQNRQTMQEGLQSSRGEYQQTQQRNEALMREGMAARQAEIEQARIQNEQMMRQKQATLQHYFSLLNQGGEGTLAAIMSPIAGQMAESWNMGMTGPGDASQFYSGMRNAQFDPSQYYSGMMVGMNPSSQYLGQMAQAAGSTQFATPDYSAWMDPESMRTGWVLPRQTLGAGDTLISQNRNTGQNSRMTNVGY